MQRLKFLLPHNIYIYIYILLESSYQPQIDQRRAAPQVVPKIGLLRLFLKMTSIS